MSTPSPFTLKHILVAVDASPASLTALDLACELAQLHNAEVTVLFVEDALTSRIAGLPDLIEIRLMGATRGALTAADLRRQYRARARRIHHALELIQRRIEISCRLQVVQGRVYTEILEATREADLLLLGRTGNDHNRKRLGSTTQRVLLQAERPVLVVHRRPPPNAPLVALYTDTPAGQRAVELAATLAEPQEHIPLRILVRDSSFIAPLRKDLNTRHPSLKDRLNIRQITPMESYSLHQVAYAEQPGLLILPHDDVHAEKDSIREYLKFAEHPLLLVQ